MKYLLLLVFTVPTWCIGQINPVTKDSLQSFKAVVYCDTCVATKIINDTLFVRGTKEITRNDTVKIIMLMTDTSEYTGPSLNGNELVFWQLGYEVRRGQFVCCDPNDKLNSSYYWMYSHLSYLNGDKKELPKSVIVWQSKQY